MVLWSWVNSEQHLDKKIRQVPVSIIAGTCFLVLRIWGCSIPARSGNPGMLKVVIESQRKTEGMMAGIFPFHAVGAVA